jgi:mono/diheme cytochrome c family protein
MDQTLLAQENLMRLLSLGVYLAFLTTAAAAEDMTTQQRGEALVTRNCSRCHAIGSVGESRHPQAPLFRTLAKRYPIEFLEEALGEGIISGHPDMPEFRFSGMDVGAIVIYLKSIQEH